MSDYPLEKVWGPRPLQLSVIDVIGRKGPLTDDELLKELRNGKEDMSFRELNRILMRLEVNGLVRVSRQMKGKRRVELVQSEQRKQE
jgi:transcription initiation factor IIE alpha subunit